MDGGDGLTAKCQKCGARHFADKIGGVCFRLVCKKTTGVFKRFGLWYPTRCLGLVVAA